MPAEKKTYKMKPAPARVAIKIEDRGRLMDSGLYIPDTAYIDKPTIGNVIEICDKYEQDGEHYEPMYRRGDVVLFGKYTGTLIQFGQDKIIVLRENDVLARLIPDEGGVETREITVNDRHD